MKKQYQRLTVVVGVLVCVFATLTYAKSMAAKDDSSSEESRESKESQSSSASKTATKTAASSTRSSVPHICTHLNRTYILGEQIATPDTPCLHCTCTKRWRSPSGSSCAIIDCPFGYYRSRPHCKTNYVEGKCCPELACAPPTPGFETELMSRKKPHTSTDKMIITAAPGKEVTLYCIAQNDGNKPLNENSATWNRRDSTGALSLVQLSPKAIAKFFPPNTWGLLLDDLQEADAAEYVCQVATTPPQTYTTTLQIDVRAPSRLDACTGPTEVKLSPGQHTCDQFPSKGWYYNSSLFMCNQYETQPCKKPVNYFSSRSECYGMCGDACYDNKNEGNCEVWEKRYYYDHVRDECSSFTYNGCRGNRNNFKSREECENTCADVKFRLLDVAGRATPVTEAKEEMPPCRGLKCPWQHWFHYIWKGCKAITEPNACCPHRFECPTTADADAEATATVRPTRHDLGAYHCAGKFADKFSISVSKCLTCSCDSDNHTFVCEGGNECLKGEEDVDKHMREGCIPVYEENKCCPHSYQCPRSATYHQRGPEQQFKEADELRCKHGGGTYPRNYELIVADSCVTCTCQTPPDFTCVVQTCPPHPSVGNATLRCEIRAIHGPQCCPEYDCWDILDKPLVLGKPQTPKEIKVCDDNPCEEHHTCVLNYTQCHLGSCGRTCRMCPTPLCSSGSYLEDVLHDCPVCAGYRTPEDACENFDACPPDTLCRVEEDKCRNEGRCEPLCEIQNEELIFVAEPAVCPMPRCPPTCGFKTGSDGCRQCDCSIPRGPIIETPCIKECPQDCGQKVLLDGCLECECSQPFFGTTPTPPKRPVVDNSKECLKECPQDCGQTIRDDGCFECHCGGTFFGNHGTPRPPFPKVPVDKVPCASVSCSFPCSAAPAEEDGCSKSCVCPKTVEEACKKLPCPKEATCTADCDAISCQPKCLLQLECPQVLCDKECTIENDENGCQMCKCP